MKNLTRIIAVAVIAVFAVISCAPPQLNESDYDWGAANTSRDAANGGSLSTDFSIDPISNGTWNSTNTEYSNPIVTITFPKESDFLREKDSDYVGKLKEFLSFNFYSNPDDTNNEWYYHQGQTSSLGAAIPYDVVRRLDNKLDIRLNYAFTENNSHVVAKIDSAKYLHSHGLQMDRDRNGIAGEAGYDDLYKQINLPSGAYNTDIAYSFQAPRHAEWVVNLSQPSASPNFGTGVDTTSEAITYIQAFTLNLGSAATIKKPTADSGDGSETLDIYKTIADDIARGVELQKLGVDGNGRPTWTKVGPAATYHETKSFSGSFNYGFQEFQAEHNATYRVYWKGAKNIETAVYHGVKQRIYVNGASNSSVAWNKERYAITEVYTSTNTWSNTNIASSASLGNVNVYSIDSNGKNVILRVEFPVLTANGNYLPFTNSEQARGIAWSSEADFKNAFKIIDGDNWLSNDALRFVDYTVKPATEGDAVLLQNGGGLGTNLNVTNVVYLTLDPSFQLTNYAGTNTKLSFIISTGLKYTGCSPAVDDTINYIFGDASDVINKYFKQYTFSLSNLSSLPEIPTPPALCSECGELGNHFRNAANGGCGIDCYTCQPDDHGINICGKHCQQVIAASHAVCPQGYSSCLYSGYQCDGYNHDNCIYVPPTPPCPICSETDGYHKICHDYCGPHQCDGSVDSWCNNLCCPYCGEMDINDCVCENADLELTMNSGDVPVGAYYALVASETNTNDIKGVIDTLAHIFEQVEGDIDECIMIGINYLDLLAFGTTDVASSSSSATISLRWPDDSNWNDNYYVIVINYANSTWSFGYTSNVVTFDTNGEGTFVLDTGVTSYTPQPMP